jgi:ABC-type phosphate transport system substrate-binding protein
MRLQLLRTLAAGLALTALLAGPLRAQTIVVISHPAVTVAEADVRDIFLGEKQFAGPTKLVPVDNSSLQETFLSKLIRLDAAKYANVWTKKAFREGMTAPPMKGSDAEVVEFVKRTPGAIGYVKAAPAGVNVVTPQ